MPTPATISEKLTVVDYRATPEGARYQLVEGGLVMAPAPNRSHQEITGNLYALLKEHALKHNLGRTYIAPFDVFLSEHNVVQPDVLFVSAANAALIHEDGVHGAPDRRAREVHDVPPARAVARRGGGLQTLSRGFTRRSIS